MRIDRLVRILGPLTSTTFITGVSLLAIWITHSVGDAVCEVRLSTDLADLNTCRGGHGWIAVAGFYLAMLVPFAAQVRTWHVVAVLTGIAAAPASAVFAVWSDPAESDATQFAHAMLAITAVEVMLVSGIWIGTLVARHRAPKPTLPPTRGLESFDVTAEIVRTRVVQHDWARHILEAEHIPALHSVFCGSAGPPYVPKHVPRANVWDLSIGTGAISRHWRLEFRWWYAPLWVVFVPITSFASVSVTKLLDLGRLGLLLAAGNLMCRAIRFPVTRSLELGTVVMVALDSTAAFFTDFDVKCRDDRTLFSNVPARRERFESEELNQRFVFDVSPDADQIDVWRDIEPSVTEVLAAEPRIVIRKRGAHILLYANSISRETQERLLEQGLRLAGVISRELRPGQAHPVHSELTS